MTKLAPTVGIVGLGFGRAHIPAFQQEGCRVVAVCQRDQASAKATADRYGVPQIFGRWEDMLETARPGIVVIATPPRLHREIALAAFARGAHVLCEKPVAMTRAEAQDMVDAAARAGRIAMTGFNWRFAPAMQRFNAMVRDGAVGRVFHLAGRWLGARWANEGVAPTWRMDRTQAGHGVMGDMGVHLIDLVRWNFGEIRRVSAHAGIAYPLRTVPGGTKPADAEDFCTVIGELTSGAQVTLTASRVARGMSEHALEAFGACGALAFRQGREGAGWWVGELRAGTNNLQLVEVGAVQAIDGDQMEIIGRATIAPLVARLLEGIRTGATPAPSLEDGLRAQAVLDAVLASASRDGWVEVS